ncbi:hypothetical protein [Oceanirhabdus seepicola]|uniref:Uncharacterized protein n=1 Tax=Oceanirhabdus seepicola TaxID=2828781 RepID=A0A9J6NY99_9CLOT|nr:hypothetical protein [Oceanirhabdus seepicola]MCM1989418.1 hypothetical protein [Oceanirhabdus seepicola]
MICDYSNDISILVKYSSLIPSKPESTPRITKASTFSLVVISTTCSKGFNWKVSSSESFWKTIHLFDIIGLNVLEILIKILLK